MSFETSINRLLGNEGGYVNDATDPGGETNWGISKRSYPLLDIRNLSREDAIAIYRRDFWNLIKGDELPQAVSFQLLDTAVNSGISTAIRLLQKAVNVADDGHWGPHSAEALAQASITDTLFLFLAERLIYMTGLKNWPSAGKGWARRIAADLKFAAQDS